jgi:hypothetical protein
MFQDQNNIDPRLQVLRDGDLNQVPTFSVQVRDGEVRRDSISKLDKKEGAEKFLKEKESSSAEASSGCSSSTDESSNITLQIPDISGIGPLTSSDSHSSSISLISSKSSSSFNSQNSSLSSSSPVIVHPRKVETPHSSRRKNSKRPRLMQDEEDEDSRREMYQEEEMQDEETTSVSDSDGGESEIPLRFPGMLRKEELYECELLVRRDLKAITSKYVRSDWKEIDILNEIMDSKLRKRFELGAMASRTFYPAPRQFIKPLKGNKQNAFRDTAWYRMQCDITIMYRFLMWSVAQLQNQNAEGAYGVLMSVVIPFIYHLLSCCQKERLNVRYPQGVVNVLYSEDSEPFLRPAHLKKAKRVVAERKDMSALSDSFFGQGDRRRGGFNRSRRIPFGPQKRRRQFNPYPPRSKQTTQPHGNRFHQGAHQFQRKKK